MAFPKLIGKTLGHRFLPAPLPCTDRRERPECWSDRPQSRQIILKFAVFLIWLKKLAPV